MIPALEKAGFSVFDPGAYEDGTSDYSSQIGKYKEADVQIFTGAPLPPGFATFWRQFAQQGFCQDHQDPEHRQNGPVPIPNRSAGLAWLQHRQPPCFWHPTFPYRSPLTGETPQELADGYEKSSDRQWNQQLGTTQSLLDVSTELLKAANAKDKADVAKTLSHFKVTTPVGIVEWGKFPIPNVTTPLIGAQWVKANRAASTSW